MTIKEIYELRAKQNLEYRKCALNFVKDQVNKSSDLDINLFEFVRVQCKFSEFEKFDRIRYKDNTYVLYNLYSDDLVADIELLTVNEISDLLYVLNKKYI